MPYCLPLPVRCVRKVTVADLARLAKRLCQEQLALALTSHFGKPATTVGAVPARADKSLLVPNGSKVVSNGVVNGHICLDFP